MSVGNYAPGTLEQLRAVFASTLVETMTIQRSANTSDGAGGTVETWPAVATDIPCRVSAPQQQPRLGVTGAASEITDTLELWAPPGTDLQVRDRVVIRPGTYRVLQVQMPTYELYVRAQIERIV